MPSNKEIDNFLFEFRYSPSAHYLQFISMINEVFLLYFLTMEL